jgi:hypothetical protein
MPITIPHDLADELAEAAHWYPGSPEMEVFLEHAGAGHSWSERWPRALLRWADRHAVPVFGHRRFVALINAGFDVRHNRWRLWRAAVTELRRCHARIQCGEEDGLAYAGNRQLLSLSDGRPPRWGPTGSEAAGVALVFPSLAGAAPEPVGATPPPTSPPGSPGAPQVPRGGWLTR